MATLFDELEHEWSRMARDPRLADRLRRSGAVPYEAAFRTLADLEADVSAMAAADRDTVMLPLVRAAAQGDHLAARVALHLLTPHVRWLAGKWWALGDPEERAAAAVAAVYARIRSFPLTRYRAVAANVRLDAEKDLRRQVARADRAEPTCDLDRPAAVDEHPAVELVEVLAAAVAAGHLSAGDAELVGATRIGGRRLADIADERGAALRTLQWRRRRAEAVLAEMAA